MSVRFTNSRRRISSFFCAIWLICTALSSLTIFGIDSPNSADLVFCPLQKQWIRKDPPRPTALDLSQFCAPARQKALFLEMAARKLRSGFVGVTAETGVFLDFLAKGDRALAELPDIPGRPEVPILTLAKADTGAPNSRGSVSMAAPALLSFDQLSRPPTFSEPGNFSLSVFHDLTSFSAPVSPRGPPFRL